MSTSDQMNEGNNLKEWSTRRERTDAKLTYARIHLDELSNYKNRGRGDDYERAHQESFLAQLIGALDAFYHEINVAHKLNLDERAVRLQNIKDALAKQGRKSQEMAEIERLLADKKSWLRLAIGFRNRGIHRSHIPTGFYVGGPDNGKSAFHDPRTGAPMKQDIIDSFTTWIVNMTEMINKHRTTLPIPRP